MALFLIVGQAHFVINNIFEGMIWFFLPVAMVITNDIWAYLCGITFGRTPLIKISPKKTWEGFLGAWFFTIIFGALLTNVMARYKYFICPVNVSMLCPFHKLLTNRPRILARTYGPVLNANQILSLHRTTIHFPSLLLRSSLFLNNFLSGLSSSTFSRLPPSLPSLLHSAVSSPQA